MLLLYAVPAGLIAGYLLGGSLSRLIDLRFRWIALIPVALLIQLLIFPWFFDRAILPVATAPLHLLSYALIGLWLLANWRIRPMVLIGLGALCNLLVLAVNGGRMPASIRALEAAGATVEAAALAEQEVVANVIRMSATTRLNGLGDLLYVPGWMPFATAFSIGDAIVFLGLVWLIAGGMKGYGKRSD